MDTPWKTIASVDTNRQYLALLTYLPLKSYGKIPRFLQFSFQIQQQLSGSRGAIGYSLRAKPLSRNFWTLSAWHNEEALQGFVHKPPHSDVMKLLMPHMGPTKFFRWKVAGSALPLRWDDAMTHMQREA